jgi:peptidoglycan/LPS O-acetylase OafA/YrhL
MNDDSTTRYLIRRALRIFPGYWVCLLVSAFALAPLMWIFRGRPGAFWTATDGPIQWLITNLPMVSGNHVIGQSLTGAPWPYDVNGSLWSLPFEFACYLMVGAFGFFAAIRQRRWPIVLFAICFFALNVVHHMVTPFGDPYYAPRLLDYGLFFACGAIVWAFAERIPATWWMATLAAIWLLAAAFAGQIFLFGGLAIAYLCIWLGARLPEWFHRIGRQHDVSYGLYLYAFPVQQVLTAAGVGRWGVGAYMSLAVLATLPLAFLSFVVVERPALALKSILRPGGHRRIGKLEGDPPVAPNSAARL